MIKIKAVYAKTYSVELFQDQNLEYVLKCTGTNVANEPINVMLLDLAMVLFDQVLLRLEGN